MTKVTKEVIRGTHFFIRKEHAEELHKQAQLYVQHTNNMMPYILSYYQNILENYKDVSLTATGVIVKNVDDAFIMGMDGKRYELAVDTNYKKGKGKTAKHWWTPSQLNDKSQDIAKVLGNTELEIYPDKGKKLKDTQIKYMLKSIFPELAQNYIFDVRDYCTNRISSRQRNKTPNKSFHQILLETVRPPLLRNLTIHSKRLRFKLDRAKQRLLYKDHNDEIISVPYEFHTPLNDVINPDGLFDKWCGGNYVVDLKRKHRYNQFTVMCNKLQTFDYMPIGWSGVDINVSRIHALTFYDLLKQYAFVWERSDYAQQMIEERSEITNQIADKNKGACNAKVRARLRKKRDIVSVRQTKYCRKIFTPFLNTLKGNRMGLAIDYVSFGASCGNGGLQESICKVLPDMCHEIGVPYHLVNPRYTSLDCSECGHRHKTKEKNKMKDTFVCKSCGWTLPMHQDAARTIATRAQNGHDLQYHSS